MCSILFTPPSLHLPRANLRPPRRTFLRGTLIAAAALLLPRRTHAWTSDQLCRQCAGRGRQPCPLCAGTGSLQIQDGIVDSINSCPNCNGRRSVRCAACIGLGLSQVNGILRNGSSFRLCIFFPFCYSRIPALTWFLFTAGVRSGTLRMRRNGSYEIMDCSAFPACDIYGEQGRSKLN